MKRILLIVVVLVAAYAVLSVQPAAVAGSDHLKYDVCHVPPGNPANAHIISVDAHAWDSGHTPHNSHALDTNCTLGEDCSACIGGVPE